MTVLPHKIGEKTVACYRRQHEARGILYSGTEKVRILPGCSMTESCEMSARMERSAVGRVVLTAVGRVVLTGIRDEVHPGNTCRVSLPLSSTACKTHTIC